MLEFALYATALVAILVFVMAIGLVAQKITYGSKARRRARLDEHYQHQLDPILLEDLPPDSLDPESLLFRQSVKRFAEPLRLELARVNVFSRRAHRASLKRVMLGMSRDLVGETLARLTKAFEVFGFVGDELRDLGSRKWWVRAKAAGNLALMRAEDATGDLVILVSDDEEDVRTEAAMALVTISGVKSLRPLLTNLQKISVWMSIRLSKVVLSMGSAAVPELVLGLRSDHSSVKAFCIDMLGEIGDISSCPALIDFAKHAEPELCAKALVAIGKLGDETGKDVLLEHLSDKNEQLRASAAVGLGLLATPETAAPLKEHLLHDTIRVRLAAGQALKRIEGGGRDFFLAAYRESDEIGKRVVLQFLEELGVPEEEIGRIAR